MTLFLLATSPWNATMPIWGFISRPFLEPVDNCDQVLCCIDGEEVDEMAALDVDAQSDHQVFCRCSYFVRTILSMVNDIAIRTMNSKNPYPPELCSHRGRFRSYPSVIPHFGHFEGLAVYETCGICLRKPLFFTPHSHPPHVWRKNPETPSLVLVFFCASFRRLSPKCRETSGLLMPKTPDERNHQGARGGYHYSTSPLGVIQRIWS